MSVTGQKRKNCICNSVGTCISWLNDYIHRKYRNHC